MGESKRRQKRTDAFLSEVVPADYGPGETFLCLDPVHEIAPGEGVHASDFALLCWARCHGPNLMRPDRFPAPHDPATSPYAALAADPDATAAVPVATGIPGTIEAAAGLPELLAVPFVRYRATGERVTLHASQAGGMQASDGARMDDPRAGLAGLVRLDPEGHAIVEADAPLSLQFIALRRHLYAGAQRKDAKAGLTPHMRHLMSLAAQIRAEPDGSLGGWIDGDALDYLFDDFADCPELTPSDDAAIAERLDGTLRSHDGLASSILGPRLGIPPANWTTRVTPACGWLWERLDRLGALHMPEGWKPSPNAAMTGIAYPNQSKATTRLDAYLAGLETVHSKGELTVSRNGDWTVVTERLRGSISVAVHPDAGGGELGRDPLMTEGLDGIELGSPPPRLHKATLGKLEILDELPDPTRMVQYALLTLVKAHRDGGTLADLCATYAAAARWPTDDPEALDEIVSLVEDEDAPEEPEDGEWPPAWFARLAERNAAAADRLAALGGTEIPRLRAMFDAALEYAPTTELPREAILLAQAIDGGANLMDFAREAYHALRRDIDDDEDPVEAEFPF